MTTTVQRASRPPVGLSVGSSSSPTTRSVMNCGSLSQILKSIHGSSTMKELEAGHNQSNTSTYANIISTINQILVIMQSTVLYQPISSPSSMVGKSTYVMFLGFACLNFQNTPMEMLVCQLCSILSKSQLQSYCQLRSFDFRRVTDKRRTMPASTQTAFNCAPFISSVDLASSSKLARYQRFIRHCT